MSDNIPFELQVEIIKRVPIKPLLRFRSVSKQWKSLIDSPEFGSDYCVIQSQPHRLLIRYIPFEQNEEQFASLMAHLTSISNSLRRNGPVNDSPNYKYVSIADDDDDNFLQHEIPSTILPQSVNNLTGSNIVGSSQGLICFCGSVYKDLTSFMAVIWNPWIRKFVDVPVPNVVFEPYETILGFGVSCETPKDPKIVKVNSFCSSEYDASDCIPWRVEVFSLSSGTWKSPSCNPPCRNSIRFDKPHVDLDGVLYWLAFEVFKVDGGDLRDHNLIMSFDLSSEGFEEICLPNKLARLEKPLLSISKRMESVVVLEVNGNGTSCGVWIMGQGVTKSFTKLFTVTPRESLYCSVRGFMKNGEPIVDHGSHALFAYDSYSEKIKDLGIVGYTESFNVKSYKETLLLIDQ